MGNLFLSFVITTGYVTLHFASTSNSIREEVSIVETATAVKHNGTLPILRKKSTDDKDDTEEIQLLQPEFDPCFQDIHKREATINLF
jgi:hypothetical protein